MNIKNIIILFKCNNCKKLIELHSDIMPLGNDISCKFCGRKDFRVYTEHRRVEDKAYV